MPLRWLAATTMLLSVGCQHFDRCCSWAQRYEPIPPRQVTDRAILNAGYCETHWMPLEATCGPLQQHPFDFSPGQYIPIEHLGDSQPADRPAPVRRVDTAVNTSGETSGSQNRPRRNTSLPQPVIRADATAQASRPASQPTVVRRASHAAAMLSDRQRDASADPQLASANAVREANDAEAISGGPVDPLDLQEYLRQ